jgi:peptidoglycan hydrolase CwlO-like protein
MIKNQYLLIGLVALGVLELVVIGSLITAERDTARELARVREELKEAIAEAKGEQSVATAKLSKQIADLQQEAKEAREWATQTETDLKKTQRLLVLTRRELDQLDERLKKATSPEERKP